MLKVLSNRCPWSPPEVLDRPLESPYRNRDPGEKMIKNTNYARKRTTHKQ